ncbi:MAG: hypothetical protein H0V67_05210 [Geodermatophilaceae bacterium]|nr:hypothetical protein [Geodermatophilaceae bacterium]
MYNNPVAALGTAGGVGFLPYTGLELSWLLLAAFALVAAGLAVMRIVPRSQA